MFLEKFSPRVLSLGLGLGYVEILAAALCLQKAKELEPAECEKLLSQFGGESFELVDELRHWFISWATEQDADLPPDFRQVYQEILERTATSTQVDPRELKRFIQELLLDGRWQIREALTETTSLQSSFGCICFDAFSSKTSPQLWTEEFLQAFFAKTCSAGCVLSTYACTGALKRTLRSAGFEIQIREGFASKRDSTFAVRTSQEKSV
jgi:hypothetical protein